MKLYNLANFNKCEYLSSNDKTQILEFISKNDLNSIALGKYPLGGKNYVNVMEYDTKADNGVYETHDLYIDVQAVIFGEEIVKVSDEKDCSLNKAYNPEKDVTLYDGKEKEREILNNTNLVVYVVGEPHKASIMVKEPIKVKKAVFKIYAGK